MNEREEKPTYNEGFPEMPGWYDVLNDGVEDRLVFRLCKTCMRFVWENIRGEKQTGTILWMPGSYDVRP